MLVVFIAKEEKNNLHTTADRTMHQVSFKLLEIQMKKTKIIVVD